MILDKEVKIKISVKNIDYYRSFYPNISLRDVILVNTENLQKGSNLKINVECDICSEKRFIKYQAYNKNINSCPEYPIYTCDKCSHLKIKEYNKKKYGVEHYSKTKEYAEKFKNTMIERYGVEYALQSQELKNKVRETNIKKYGVENPFMDNEMIKFKFKEKYGVEHPSKVEEFKNKAKNTMMDRYGVEYALQNVDLKNKAMQTNLERYGNVIYSKSAGYIDRAIKSNLAKYGKNWAIQSEIVKNKAMQTNLKKYGVDNFKKSEESRKGMIISNDTSYVKYLDNGVSLFICSNGHEFEINIDRFHSRKKYNIPLCTICNPIGSSTSIKEKTLFEFIQSIYSGEIVKSYRDELGIDIYLPELKIGFEFNGLYWHSEQYKNKNHHIDKTNYFKSKGIRIIHIWEDDWDYKPDIVKSTISNLIGINCDKIFARKCFVREISNSSKFLNDNHIQGSDNSVIKLGLYHNNELVSLMTFNRFEGRKKMGDQEWNLSRFCNKLNTTVIGGASKLLTFFIKKYSPKRIVSYADKDWSIGNLYYKLGFVNINESKPDYKYIINGIRRNKQSFKKSKMGIDKSITESKFMELNGYYKIWDCGKIKFEKIIQ